MSFNVDKNYIGGTQQNYGNFQFEDVEAVEQEAGLLAEQDTLSTSPEEKKKLKQKLEANRPHLVSPGKGDHIKDLQNLLLQQSIERKSAQKEISSEPQSEEEQQIVYIEAFHEALDEFAKQNQLSSKDIESLKFAFFNPAAFPSETKLSNGNSLESSLNSVIADAQALAKNQGVSPSTLSSSIPNENFNLNLSDAYNIAFEKSVESSDLTPEEKSALIFMHYNPGSSKDSKLTTRLKNFQDGALLKLSQQYGIPSGWSPQLNSSIYNGVLYGNFQVNLQVEFNKSASNLSEVEIEQLKNAIQNIDVASIPPKIKELAQYIIEAASTQTKLQNGLPILWKPDAGLMNGIFKDIASSPITTAFVQANEMMNSLSHELILIVPESVTQSVTMDMLTAITQAIIKAQNAIYELQRSQSEVSKDEAIARKEMVDQKVREREEQLNKVHKEGKKQKKLSKVMKTLKPIMKVMSIATAIASGPLGLAFFFLNDEFNFTEDMIKGISKGVGQLVDKMIPSNGNKALEKFKMGLKSVGEIAAFTALLATGVGFTLLIAIGPMQTQALMSQIITDGNWVQNFCRMCGVPKEDIQWVVLGVNMSFTVACAVASVFVPGGSAVTASKSAQTAVMAAEQSAKITEDAVTATQAAIKQAQMAITVAANITKDATAAAETTTAATSAATRALNAAAKAAQEAMTTIQTTLGAVVQRIKDTRLFQKMIQLLEKFLEADKSMNIINKLSQGMKFVGLANTGLSTANSTLQGFYNLSQKRLSESRGKHEATIEMLEAMIKNLQKILNSLLDGMSNYSEDLAALSALHGQILNSLSATLNEITNTQFK